MFGLRLKSSITSGELKRQPATTTGGRTAASCGRDGPNSLQSATTTDGRTLEILAQGNAGSGIGVFYSKDKQKKYNF